MKRIDFPEKKFDAAPAMTKPGEAAPGRAAPMTAAKVARNKTAAGPNGNTAHTRYQPVIGQSVYNQRNQKIGTIQGIVVSKEKGDLYKVAGAEGYLGVGRIPSGAFTLTDDKLYLRAEERINFPILNPASGHLRPLWGSKILELALLVLRFCSPKATKSDLNPGSIFGKFILSSALNSLSSRLRTLHG